MDPDIVNGVNASYFGTTEGKGYILICMRQIFKKYPSTFLKMTTYYAIILNLKYFSVLFGKYATYKLNIPSNLYWGKYGAFYCNNKDRVQTLSLVLWLEKYSYTKVLLGKYVSYKLYKSSHFYFSEISKVSKS